MKVSHVLYCISNTVDSTSREIIIPFHFGGVTLHIRDCPPVQERYWQTGACQTGPLRWTTLFEERLRELVLFIMELAKGQGGREGGEGTGLIAVTTLNRIIEEAQPHCSQRYQGQNPTTFKYCSEDVVQHWNRLSRGAVKSCFFELFKTQLNNTLNKLI